MCALHIIVDPSIILPFTHIPHSHPSVRVACRISTSIPIHHQQLVNDTKARCENSAPFAYPPSRPQTPSSFLARALFRKPLPFIRQQPLTRRVRLM